MDITGKVYCFFEQSGTFKNEFKKLGYEAVDVDIQNNFGQTDHVVDLFKHIEDAYDGKLSIFDNMSAGDLIMAFFPCIYFSSNNTLHFDGSWITYHQRGMTELEINEQIIQRNKDRAYFYELLLKLFCVCTMKQLRMIVENPYATHHYLHANFPYKPKVIDYDRRRRGDYFKKPTQYFFHNCEPTYGESFQEPLLTLNVKQLSGRMGGGLCNEERSMIAPEYARNFICDFILGKAQKNTELTLF